MSHIVSQRNYFKMHYSFVCLNRSLISVEIGGKTWDVRVEWGDYRTTNFCMTFEIRLKI